MIKIENNEKIPCTNCGTQNDPNSKFCTKCGASIAGVDKPEEKPTEAPKEPETKEQPTPSNGKLNYFKHIIDILKKPITNYKKEEGNLNNWKNIGILAAILIGIATVLRSIASIILTVRVKSYMTNEVVWSWNNLTASALFKIIGRNILVYSVILIAMAGVYYLASLVIKKEIKFIKMAAIAVTAFIPYVLGAAISPVFTMIYDPLGTAVIIIGIVYMVGILYMLTDEAIKIEDKDNKLYFHAICMAIILLVRIFIQYI